VSCEHGGNRVPPRFRSLLSRTLLDSHRGYDPGALAVARDIAAATAAPLHYSTVSRLLIELNRPLGHPQLLHLKLPEATRETLLRRHYFPYWRGIESTIRKAVQRGRQVVHLSVHSFTPRFRGVRRTTDIGLLFDPARPAEAAFCRAWRGEILRKDARLEVHENQPYAGAHPSVVASMREKFSARRYLGIQIEINQKYPRGDARRWRELRKLLRAAFEQALPSAGWRKSRSGSG
jgi:predicted N-formylglutamate amidohydrolase